MAPSLDDTAANPSLADGGGSDAHETTLNPAAPYFSPSINPRVHVRLTVNPSFYYYLYPPSQPPLLAPPYYVSATFTSPPPRPPPPVLFYYPRYNHNYSLNPSSIQPPPPRQHHRLPPPVLTTEPNPHVPLPDQTHLTHEAKVETSRQNRARGKRKVSYGGKTIFGRKNDRRGDSGERGKGSVSMVQYGNTRAAWRDPGAVVPVQYSGQITTVMIRNIPNKYTRQMLTEFLDKHCRMENESEKAKFANTDSENESVCSAYDFLYLPMDFESGMNKGYAFVNFTDARAVWKFHIAYNNQPWELFNSKKRLEVASARIQGKDVLVRHFQRMTYPVAEYSAVWFSPARTGSTDGTMIRTIMVGKCTGSSS